MAKQFFSQFRWALFADSHLRCALGAVAALDAEQLADTEAVHARLTGTPALRIPRLDTAAMTVVPAIRKVLTSRFSLTFAEERLLRVTIPYTGDAVAFDVRPTAMPEGDPLRGRVGEFAISFSVPDDPWSSYAVDRAMTRLADTLDALRTDVAACEFAVGEAVETAMLARQAPRAQAEVVAFRAAREAAVRRPAPDVLPLAS